MYEILALMIITVVLKIAIESTKKKKKQQKFMEKAETLENPERFPDVLPYTKSMLLTKAEYAFYRILKERCDNNNILICPKVRMEDFLDITDKKNQLKWRGYIRSRHIDFLICDDKLRILAGCELDDNSHKDKSVIETDKFKDNVFRTIGIPLYRIKMTDGLYENQIDKMLDELKNTANE